MGDGVDPPQFGTGLDVVAGDEATAGLGIAAAGHALDDLAVHDERTAGVAPALVPIGGLVVPNELSGFGVERNDMSIRGGDDQLVVIDCDVALRQILAVVGEQLGRQIAFVFPDEVAGRAVWAVAPAIVGAPPHQPIRRRRIAQHGVGHRRQALAQICGLRCANALAAHKTTGTVRIAYFQSTIAVLRGFMKLEMCVRSPASADSARGIPVQGAGCRRLTERSMQRSPVRPDKRRRIDASNSRPSAGRCIRYRGCPG
jgi:hypothetical protein